jgi:hypothetical protein
MKKFTNLVLASAAIAIASSPSLVASSSAANQQDTVVQIIQDDSSQLQNMGNTGFQSADSQVSGTGANLDDDGGDDEKPKSSENNSKKENKNDIFGALLGAVAKKIENS